MHRSLPQGRCKSFISCCQTQLTHSSLQSQLWLVLVPPVLEKAFEGCCLSEFIDPSDGSVDRVSLLSNKALGILNSLSPAKNMNSRWQEILVLIGATCFTFLHCYTLFLPNTKFQMSRCPQYRPLQSSNRTGSRVQSLPLENTHKLWRVFAHICDEALPEILIAPSASETS